MPPSQTALAASQSVSVHVWSHSWQFWPTCAASQAVVVVAVVGRSTMFTATAVVIMMQGLASGLVEDCEVLPVVAEFRETFKSHLEFLQATRNIQLSTRRYHNLNARTHSTQRHAHKTPPSTQRKYYVSISRV